LIEDNLKTISFKDKEYPHFQSTGFAARFIFPFAFEFCKGVGYDIGCNRTPWCLPGAVPIDLLVASDYEAMRLPKEQVDYIFSSHCLEHLPSWVDALLYWSSKIKLGGILFLYLPDKSQEYWLPWNNRKHLHVLDGEVIKKFLIDNGFSTVLVSGVDLNSSFCIVAEKG
jgi:SAM-dependent methyltransferase